MLFNSTTLLALHSLWRWVVLVSAAITVVQALRGWMFATPWTAANRRIAVIFVGILDVQLTFGLLLVAFSATAIRAAFWPHMTAMLAAVVLAHVGKLYADRGVRPSVQHRRAALVFLPVFAIMLAAIPPSRPLLRL